MIESLRIFSGKTIIFIVSNKKRKKTVHMNC